MANASERKLKTEHQIFVIIGFLEFCFFQFLQKGISQSWQVTVRGRFSIISNANLFLSHKFFVSRGSFMMQFFLIEFSTSANCDCTSDNNRNDGLRTE